MTAPFKLMRHDSVFPMRNPQRMMVAMSEITPRSAMKLIYDRDLRVVTTHGTGLLAIGTDNAISTGPYDPKSSRREGNCFAPPSCRETPEFCSGFAPEL